MYKLGINYLNTIEEVKTYKKYKANVNLKMFKISKYPCMMYLYK